jgi:hypothetical protein
VKVPEEVRAKIAELGVRVIDEGDDLVDIGSASAIWLADTEFGLTILATWIRKEVRTWVGIQARAIVDSPEATGQLVLPIPDLPAYLEVAPGVKKHQRMMTRRDWENTVAIYRNRRDQAEILWRQIEQWWERLERLLPDDETTTADIMGELEEGTG